MLHNISGITRPLLRSLSGLVHLYNPESLLRLARRSYRFWLLVGMLILSGVLHYQDLFPQTGWKLPLNISGASLERILFLLPVVYGGFVFGIKGGAITLSIAVLVMLSRAVFASSSHPDAVLETVAVTVVAGLVLVWLGGQESEKGERKEALVKLETARQELAAHVDIIKRNERILAAINEVCRVVNQSLEIPGIVQQILPKVREVVRAEASLLFLLDEQSGQLELTAQLGIEKPANIRVGFGMGEGYVGKVAQSGESVIVDDISQEPELRTVFPELTIQNSLLIVPLRSKGAIIGVICVVKGKAIPFSTEDVQLMTAICDQIGIGVENAHLYQQMRASEQKYRDIFENALVAIFLHDLQGKILEANKASSKLTGYEYEELIGMNISRLSSPVTDKLATEMEEKLLRGEVIEQPYDIRLLRKDGIECIVSLTTQLITEKGQTIGFQHLARDVTERRRLRESMDYYLRQVLTAQEDERKRISRELHDETGQSLLLLGQRLDQLYSDNHVPEATRLQLKELRGLVIQTLNDLRQLTQDLRPRILDDLGLIPALE